MQRIRQLLEQTSPVKWLFDGDSITHGAVNTRGGRDYTEHFAERVRYEFGTRTRDIVLKSAISGNTTRQLLEDFDWRAGQFRPDVAFIMIGMNDCSTTRNVPIEEFEANLNTLCERFAAIGSLAVLQTTCPIIPGTTPDREPYFPAFMDVIRRVACERQLPLVDHLAYWEQHLPFHVEWMANAFHPNAAGHIAFAAHLFDTIGIGDPASQTCRHAWWHDWSKAAS